MGFRVFSFFLDLSFSLKILGFIIILVSDFGFSVPISGVRTVGLRFTLVVLLVGKPLWLLWEESTTVVYEVVWRNSVV
jgi:hypothetical protein